MAEQARREEKIIMKRISSLQDLADISYEAKSIVDQLIKEKVMILIENDPSKDFVNVSFMIDNANDVEKSKELINQLVKEIRNGKS